MYNLIWNNEVVDSFTTKDEAEDMDVEYRLAYDGPVKVVKADDEEGYGNDYDDVEDDGDWMDADALASAGFGTDEDYGGYGGDEW